ncbi:putative polyketide synthase [Trichoderma barbatum]
MAINQTVPPLHPENKTFLQKPLAIVGIACRLPGHSTTPNKLWDFLQHGGVANNQVPKTRFNQNSHYDGSTKPKTMRSPGGMFIEDVDPRDFDASFFGISGSDATAMDPQQRQLLEVVYECIENAGVPIENLSGAKIGCYVGSYAVDYGDMQARDPEDRVPDVILGTGRAMLSNRISHAFNFKGPSMTIDTACSGSLVGLDVAARYLHTGEADGAICAGANLYLSPEHNLDSGAMKATGSLSGRCHTFDAKADGYVKAEAINAIYVKRLEDAVRDGDPIRAVIRGIASNSDGRTPGIASPSDEAQAEAIRSAYANAGITNFHDTAYLEFHGTGTQAGDPQEVKGVASVFSASRLPESPLIIGSIKSNVGHSEPAAGISGVIKTVLAIEHGVIPGNPTFITPNPKIDFEGCRVRAIQHKIPWPAAPFKRASVNSFGYGGSNAHVILEEPKVLLPGWKDTHCSSFTEAANLFDDDDEEDERMSSSPRQVQRPFLYTFSGNNEISLKANVKVLKNHLTNPSVKVSLSDLAYTLNLRRSRHFNRGYIVSPTAPMDEQALVSGKQMGNDVKVGFIFTGQGAQWPQMGKALIETFHPHASEIIAELDQALQSSVAPPRWSLLEELTVPRETSHLRLPEFSQPLVTALQIVLVEVLSRWGVKPQSVVGHSSGEIAAAYAAGLLSKQDAIRAAYYRGHAAASNFASISKQTAKKLGMMAIGIGAVDLGPYLAGLEDRVQIACYNSDRSLTLSGTLDGLEEMRAKLTADGKFARLLQVDLAYHSTFMKAISSEYIRLMSQDFAQDGSLKVPSEASGEEHAVQMFSSVTGKRMTKAADAEYWRSNMVCPVLFDQALEQMITAKEGAVNFLIEIGPSGALKGPVSQVLKGDGGLEIPPGIQYCSAMARGEHAIQAIFDVAGRIYMSGGSINLAQVNQRDGEVKPRFLVDLPNYAWDHSTKYWYESEASKDWRNRLFPHHDLLGSKVLGSPWHNPTFAKSLNVKDLVWLKDHKMGSDLVFPATGYLAMAMEAIYQKMEATNVLENDNPGIKQLQYRFRDVEFNKAMVLNENGLATKVQLTLTAAHTAIGSWHQFKIFSMAENNALTEHVRGLIRTEEGGKEVRGVKEELKPLELPVDGAVWRKSMIDIGYNFGPSFSKILQVESLPGERFNRSLLSLEPPAAEFTQSTYPMHPTAIDACLQACAPSLWAGHRNAVTGVLVPAIIDNLTITPSRATQGLALTTSRYVGYGRRDDIKNFVSDAAVYDSETGLSVLKLNGLHYHRIDTGPTVYDSHTFSALSWKPDLTFISQSSMEILVAEAKQPSSIGKDASVDVAENLIIMAAHKKPVQRVLELNNVPGEHESIWVNAMAANEHLEKPCRHFCYLLQDPEALVEAGQKYNSDKTELALMENLIDLTQVKKEATQFDLVIVRMSPDTKKVKELCEKIREVASQGAQVLFLHQRAVLAKPKQDSVVISGEDEKFDVGSYLQQLSELDGFSTAGHITFEEATNMFASLSLFNIPHKPDITVRQVAVYRLSSEPGPNAIKALDSLQNDGWILSHYGDSSSQSVDRVLVLDELDTSLLTTSAMTADRWNSFKDLLASGKRILWVTVGSQMDVSLPDRSMIHGLTRTARAEDPSLSLTTLDVTGADHSCTARSIQSLLQHIGCCCQPPNATSYLDSEFVERRGLIHVSRVLPDNQVNKVSDDARPGAAQPVSKLFNNTESTIQLHSERVGTITSLMWNEVATSDRPLQDHMVEVDMYAAGVNFKDVAISMGIVPEDEHLLGFEGSGKIRRVGKGVSDFQVGQRVVMCRKGCFTNRFHVSSLRVWPIPDSMSYEEAATLSVCYLTALYSIYDLANTQPGHKVLVHSASGGLGLAAIQILKYIGCEIFVTVGDQRKRALLMNEWGIPADHIFYSRDISFAADLMKATNGYGADVILNSLTGDLLDESWRCIADGGTLVELGKRDMLDRKALSMEPFGRNASYRCVDIGHDQISDELLNRLLRQIFTLLEGGHIKPITPMTVFPYQEITGALQRLRSATHLGKLVISSGGEDKPFDVMVRPRKREIYLRNDVSYLLVGGLKGLCGSLAVHMATLGARRFAILARSGYQDDVSRRVLRQLKVLGCTVDLLRGDVSCKEDVKREFKKIAVPVGGVIQGAMVLRDRIFTSMTIEDYQQTVSSKIQGTWNLHNVLLEEGQTVDFFTMLSSVSGIVGNKGQANYAAANTFLDSFAAYRRGLGLKANSVDLGAIQDVGYLSHNKDILSHFDDDHIWTPVNEPLMLKLVEYSIRQQIDPISTASESHLITSIAVPQRETSFLIRDGRFGTLCFGNQSGEGSADAKNQGFQEVQNLLLLVKNKASYNTVHQATIEAVVQFFTMTMNLSEAAEPTRPLAGYGLDSLAAVEFRNRLRMELKVETTILEITTAASLSALSEKIATRMIGA